MRGYYRLLNAEFARWLLFLAGLCGSAIALPLLLLRVELREYGPYMAHDRYEDLFIASGSGYFFVVFLLLVLVFFAVEDQRKYSGGKLIYTYLTLPIRREAYYFSRLTVLITAILLLIACIAVAFRLGYSLYENRIGSYEDGAFVMQSGWFLATIRSEFYRLLLPLSFSRGLSSLALLLTISTLFYYLLLASRSKKRWGIIIVFISFLTMSRLIMYRWTESLSHGAPSGLYMSSAILLACSIFFVWHSLHMIRRGQMV